MERNDTVQEQQLEMNGTLVNTIVQNSNTENHHSRWNSWSKLKKSLNNLKNSKSFKSFHYISLLNLDHRTLPHIPNERKLVFEDVSYC